MFFSNIPHDFGFKDIRTMKITDKQKLDEKLEFLDLLSNLKITKSITNNSENEKNIIEQSYDQLNNKITPVDKNSDLFSTIDDFIQNGKSLSHNHFDLELLEAFELERQGEDTKYKKDIGNKMLLWHGSRLTNYVGLLSQGLRIAPPEAPSTGYMFGKGVYFTDMIAKSSTYCHHHLSGNIGLLMICEVALGESNELVHADYNASKLPHGKLSVKGCGATGPDDSTGTLIEGVTLPMGPGVATGVQGSLQYNEYVVYNED
jgi:poly [ADP-ribose] polymerase 2/3/4